MNNIYIFLKNVWTDLIKSKKENVFFIPYLLLLITISLPLGVNNFFLAFFIFIFLINVRKLKFKNNYFLLVPIILFIWMVLSYFWTIDEERTLKAIPKEISLLIIPLIFLFIKPFNDRIKEKIIKYYSFSIVLFALYFIFRALVRYFISGDSRAFFTMENMMTIMA